MVQLVQSIAQALGVFLVQWLVLDRLSFYGATPDAVLLYVTWIALTQGRLSGCLHGFGLGLLLDAVHGTWGIHMLVKSLMGFLVGLFPPSERESSVIQPTQALVGGSVIALVHNGLLVTLIALQTGVRTSALITALWLGSAVYTGFVALLTALFARS